MSDAFYFVLFKQHDFEISRLPQAASATVTLMSARLVTVRMGRLAKIWTEALGVPVRNSGKVSCVRET